MGAATAFYAHPRFWEESLANAKPKPRKQKHPWLFRLPRKLKKVIKKLRK